ncbi:MAG: hypothetical protein R3C11_06510 [Planctomycetaceae bacterium]
MSARTRCLFILCLALLIGLLTNSDLLFAQAGSKLAFARELMKGTLPKDKNGKVLNLDFETGTLEDWETEGDAFAGQPIKGDTVNPRRPESKSRHQGEFWIGGYEKVADTPTGVLTSASFPVTAPWATFLLGGGGHNETSVELVEKASGDVLAMYVGVNTEDLFRVIVDLREHQGEEDLCSCYRPALWWLGTHQL